MNAAPKPLPFDLASLHGLSETLLRSHHENNYGGAVRRLNAIRAELSLATFSTLPGFQLNGLKREELIATNSMVLHELYFASLGPGANNIPAPMAVALTANFGSVQRWRDEFIAMGRALSGGSGWVLLSFQPRDGSLVNQWASDHAHALAGAVPILALDMYEHAYHLDYGARAGEYVDAFMGNILWPAVHARYQQAVHDAGEPLAATHDEVDRLSRQDGALVLDVRRAGAYEQSQQVLPGALWRDPASVGQWAGELEPGAKVVVYCVAGHEMSRATALRLRAAGLDARFLAGGIDGWAASGLPLATKPPS